MDELRTLMRTTGVELLKFRSKSVTRVALIVLFLCPIGCELLLMWLSRRDAVFPRVYIFLFGDVLIFIAVATVVVSVMALGNDYELGTIRCILSRGVSRSQFILSKILATFIAALVYGAVYIAGALLSASIVHISISDIPLFDAVGDDLLWRILGAIAVIGIVEFVASGIVMIALVLWRSSWAGMLAGLGYFFIDLFLGGMGPADLLGIRRIYRYTIMYNTRGILEKLFPSDPMLSLPRSWSEEGFADPWSALAFLLLYGCALVLVSIFLFRRQDLKMKE
jgi:ABC-type transport system involved in multi-copper enzyme maturation permease subunit